MQNNTTNDQFHNDASKSRYGDIYQYIVALEYCLNAKAGSTIYIEQRGDVANSSATIEVKHHESINHTIAEKHTDFWKTIKNWVVNKSVIKEYNELILLTTSNITFESKLDGWNELTSTQKLTILEEVKNDVISSGNNKTISPFITYIFDFSKPNYNKSDLLFILERFTIISNQPRIIEKINNIQNLNQFKYIPVKNRVIFIQELLAYIIIRCVVDDLNEDSNSEIKASESWVVRIDSFNAFAENKLKHYVKDSIPILTTYRNHIADINKYSQYVFVREIEKINYNSEIQDAVNNYHRTYLTTLDMSDRDPLFTMAIEEFQDTLLDNLSVLKKTIILENDCKNEEKAELTSKICFMKAMALDIKSIEGYNLSHVFFQRGLIHQLVNIESFIWHINVY